MNICLINPPSPWLQNQKAFPPLGLGYLASALKAESHDVSILDIGVSPDINLLKADVYGITATTPQYPEALKIRDKIRQTFPDSKLILGGAHATFAMNGATDGFDFVIKGDGEKVLPYIVQHNKLPTSTFTYQIDSIAPPDRVALNIGGYGYRIGKEGQSATTIITSRGCPYSCAFCAKYHPHAYVHSAAYVSKEIDGLVSVHGIRNLLFLDDCFTLNKERLKKICKTLKEYDIRFRCYIRADTPKETLKLLRDSGCVEVGMGIESGSQEILNIVNKGTTVKQNTETVQYCNSIGLMVSAFLMIGLPGETYSTAMETVEWVERAQPSKFGYNMFIPYPGSKIFEDRDKYPITIYDVPNEKAYLKGKDQGIMEAFVSTPDLSRQDITSLFHGLFKVLVDKTGWDPSSGEFAPERKN